jgi:hypothetical protein
VENVKTVNISMFAAVLLYSFASRSPLHAQPASPGHAQPASPGQTQPTSPSQTQPTRAGHAQPATSGYAQPTSANVSVQGDDKAWNRGVPFATREAARTVFLEGNRLFKVPLFAQAAEQYLAALSKWKHPAFYFNLAIAQLNLGQDLEARDNLEQALKHGPEPLGADEFQEAKKQLQEVQRHLGRIRVSCPTAGAEVTLDGTPLFTGPSTQEVWVKPQAHEVTAKRAEYATQAKHVTPAPGATEPVSHTLRKLVEDRPWATWKPWAVVGTGATIAAAGGVLHWVSSRGFTAYDNGFQKLMCGKQGCTTEQINEENPRLTTRLDHARLEQKLAVGGYLTGGVLIAAGVALVYMNRPHLMEQEGTNPGIAVVPVVSGDTLGVLVSVSH